MLAPRVADLNTLLADFEKMLRRVIGEDVEMIFRPGAGPEPVRVDPGQLEQAVMNLVVNARDAMPRGGTLTLDTTDVELDQPLATSHGPVPPGRYAVLSVTDTGEGIDPANLSRIFEPFFTTKPVGEGTGLGLASVYGMVAQSGGNVEVASQFGRGSCFRIYLPRVSEEALESATPPPDAESLRGDETVLTRTRKVCGRSCGRRSRSWAIPCSPRTAPRRPSRSPSDTTARCTSKPDTTPDVALDVMVPG